MNKTEFAARKRLLNDFPYYSSNLLYIRTKSGHIEKFSLNEAQNYLHGRLEQQKKETGKVRALILKGRQQGCSTYVGGRFYHRTTHYRGIRSFILTHEQEATANLFEMVERYHELMEPDMKPQTGASNRKELIFDLLDSGYRVGTAGTKGVGRSSTIQLFHGSEVAFWPHAKTHAAGILQTIPDADGTEVILESTANGLGNYFHETWQQALVGANDYIPIFIPWFWQHEYQRSAEGIDLTDEEIEYQGLHGLSLEQISWRRKKIIDLGDPLLFKQEYPATAQESFQTTGIESFIRSEEVLRARKQKPYYSDFGAIVAGFDPARDGDDRDTFIYRRGITAWGLEYNNFNEFPQKVAYCKKKLECKDPYITKLFIDYGGSGWEIAGMLREEGFKDRIAVINFGSESSKEAYLNKRAEMYGEAKKWLYDKNEPPSIPDDDSLHADLTATTFTYNSKNKIKLERKAEIKKRLLRSPDSADALVLTFAQTIGPVAKKMANPLPTRTYF